MIFFRNIIVVFLVNGCVLAGVGAMKLSLWIDSKQVNDFVGYPVNMDIYVIQEGIVSDFLLNPDIGRNLPDIKYNVRLANLTWKADDMYSYYFADLRSMEDEIMYNPLLSIPASGHVPYKQTVFQMAIPCTGRKTGVAPFIVVLHIKDKYGRALEGSPIKLHFRKQCEAFGMTSCDMKCLNGGKCDVNGVCMCKENYFGPYCESTKCSPLCLNNATCGDNKECVCQQGYRGKYCQEAMCDLQCANGGRCIAPNKCWCPPGYQGEQCWFKTCKKTCENGGTCLGSSCRCPSGFGGQYCQKESCSKPCANGGTCQGDSCRCPAGYEGKYCQKVLCRTKCGPHGSCVGLDRCRCQPGWHGKLCTATFTYGIKSRDRNNNRMRRAQAREERRLARQRKRRQRMKRNHKRNKLHKHDKHPKGN